MTRRLTALTLCLLLLLYGCLPARADVAALDKALSGWLGNLRSVRFSAVLQLKTLMPFEEKTLTMLNAVLSHVTVVAAVTQDGANGSTAAGIAVDGETMADWTETLLDGRYAFATSLLPNRTLTSAAASPSEILMEQDDEEGAADSAPADDGLNDSDIARAFSMPDAIPEMQGCYQALTDGIQPFATEKKANYSIKGVGKGAWSRVARLDAEQAEGLLPRLRALLACGMDDAFRAEVAQMTFARGLVVALYRDANGEDLCVYVKGDAVYPDGTKRRLSWQWAFTTRGSERTDTFTFEVTKASGVRDTRLIDASCKQENGNDALSLDCETETTLKRYKTVDGNATRIELKGKRGADGTLTCKGSVSRTLTQTAGEDAAETGDNATADLLFTPAGDGYALSGTVDVLKSKDGETTSELAWTLAAENGAAPRTTDATDKPVAGDDTKAGTADAKNGNAVTVSIIPAEPTATPDADIAADTANGQTSSLEQLGDEPAPTPAKQPAFLVGSAPLGLAAFAETNAETTVDLDSADAETVRNLLLEAAQNLAGKLILAVQALPGEDGALLKDGMTDADYAAFLTLLETMNDE